MQNVNFKKIDSQSENDIQKFIELREKSLKEDVGNYNLMVYPDEEKDFTIKGYKKYDVLKNYFVLENKNEFIGYIAYRQLWYGYYQGEHNFNIGPLYIDDNFRGLGYGKYITNKLINYINNEYDFSLKNISLMVNTESLIAQNLYKSLGFYEVGIQKNYIKTKEGYFDVVVMYKEVLK